LTYQTVTATGLRGLRLSFVGGREIDRRTWAHERRVNMFKRIPKILVLAVLVGATAAAWLGYGSQEVQAQQCYVPDTYDYVCGAPCDPYSVEISVYDSDLSGLSDTCPRYVNPCSHCCAPGHSCDGGGYHPRVPCGNNCSSGGGGGGGY
jgi:hypothetical protein